MRDEFIIVDINGVRWKFLILEELPKHSFIEELGHFLGYKLGRLGFTDTREVSDELVAVDTVKRSFEKPSYSI